MINCVLVNMATSSSEGSSSAPIDFHLSSSNEECSSRISLNLENCPLCKKARRKFYCKDCIRAGDFVRSTAPFVERFADMQVLLQRRKRQRRETQDECEVILARKIKADKLRCEIEACKERITLLRNLTAECKENLVQNQSNATSLRDVNRQRSERLPRYQERVTKLEKYARQSEENTLARNQELIATQQQLKQVVRKRAGELIKYIFPIVEVIPASRSEDEDSMEDTVTSAIAEASHTAFVRGRWVFSDCSGELHHCIVAPTLPVSGDYSAYSMWVAANKDGVPGTGGADSVEHNSAYTISAALTYTTQLVNVLAFYLDVRLPKKQCYSDFCRHEMSDQQFARRVARLNSNVLHLCFSQNVPPSLLHPTRTLHNLLQLLNPEISDLGRQGCIEVEPELAKSLESQLTNDLEAPEGSDEGSCSEGEGEEDLLPGEWEAVPSLPYQESGAGALVGRSTMDSGSRGLISGQGSVASQSVAGGLVTSAAASLASMWRGWTGNTK